MPNAANETLKLKFRVRASSSPTKGKAFQVLLSSFTTSCCHLSVDKLNINTSAIYPFSIIQVGTMSSPTPPPTGPPSKAVPSYKAYTGPDPNTVAVQRSKAEAERYWARMSRKSDESVLPLRVNKALGFGGWIAGTGVFISFTGYMPSVASSPPMERGLDSSG